jgi:hypothetical protein
MAKEQGISLTPAEITGMCGRLRCCLVFENEYYSECRKKLPKKNKHVLTPQGEGKVIEVFPLRDSVLVEIPEVGRREYKREQLITEDQKEESKSGREGSKEKDASDDTTDMILSLVTDTQKEQTGSEESSAERKDRSDRREKRDKENRGEKNDRGDRRDRSNRPNRKPERNNVSAADKSDEITE